MLTYLSAPPLMSRPWANRRGLSIVMSLSYCKDGLAELGERVWLRVDDDASVWTRTHSRIDVWQAAGLGVALELRYQWDESIAA